ncbi:hypothetical protein [Pedobacter sp.]
MLDVKNVIHAINKALEPFFIKGEGGYFSLSQHKSSNVFRLKLAEDCSDAYDDYGNGGDSVKVVKWFSDYWLFVEIKFHHPKGVLITLSIFQGNETDSSKNQLFRAEWDDYEDGSMNHPQPHWHFLSNKSIENTVSSFAEIASNDIKDTFEEVLNEEKSKTIDLSKFHFAMNGDWNNTSAHIHAVNNENSLARWFGGLLAYLKTELKYIDSKRGISL